MKLDDEVKVKSTLASTSNADYETDDCAVDFGDEDALARTGLQKIMPADKNGTYVRAAVLTDVCKVRTAWMHFIQVSDKKSAYRCLSVRDKRGNITTQGPCCAKLNGDDDQRAQLNFAVLAIKYKNADPGTGKYKKQADGSAPPILWEVGWIKLSQAGFKAVSDLVMEGEEAYSFDFAISYRDNGMLAPYVNGRPYPFVHASSPNTASYPPPSSTCFQL
ncbi:hypothetical protein [Edaphobacter modestus]|uniref:Uncharacterized protein n=1 Tax=Edaphobacter modestus TaxID=388466 RepID=A0A4Q7YNG7_9BACT|nr:hypothetical protein [Edaphobacter modestus]RZU39177.1 hypothetical protein BDD14_0524 [Edaphobacter modestus]